MQPLSHPVQDQVETAQAPRDVRRSIRILSLVNVTHVLLDRGQSSFRHDVNRYDVGHIGLCAMGCF
jgi:hypothetical protein